MNLRASQGRIPHVVPYTESPELAIENSSAPPIQRRMHTTSCTGDLGARRGELVRLHNRRDRIHESVLTKLRLGMNYDEAWEHVKRDHPTWFND